MCQQHIGRFTEALEQERVRDLLHGLFMTVAIETIESATFIEILAQYDMRSNI